MNSINLNSKTLLSENVLISDKYQQLFEALLEKLLTNYALQKDPFAPLSILLPNHWNSILLTAIKRNMFKKHSILLSNGKKRFMWVLSINPNAIIDGYINVSILAKIIKEDTISLRKLIWKKNGWGNPYPNNSKTLNLHNPHEKANESCEDFITRGHELLNKFIPDTTKREYILRQIYNYGMNLYNYGYEKAINDIANGYRRIN